MKIAEEALAVWNRPSTLLKMVYSKRNMLTRSRLPFKASPGFENGLNAWLANERIKPELGGRIKHNLPLSNAVVLAHLDVNELVKVISKLKFGESYTFKEIDDFAFPVDDKPLPPNMHGVMGFWYRYKSVEQMVEAVGKVSDTLFDEYLNVDTHDAFDGSNYIYYDGKEVFYVQYLK